MSTRIRTLIVVLDDDYREEDVQLIVRAIEMVRGVGDVERGPLVGLSDHIARDAARREIRDQIAAVLWPARGKDGKS